jgi:hypothetical protein
MPKMTVEVYNRYDDGPATGGIRMREFSPR